MSRYDWSSVPKEVNWIATDEDGDVRGFCKKPELRFGFWVDVETPYYFETNMTLIDDNWENSLEERPNE